MKKSIVKKLRLSKILLILPISLILIFNPFFSITTLKNVKADTIWDQISNLQEKMDELNRSIQEEQSKIDDYSNKIEDAKSRIDSLNSIIIQKNELINDTQKKIDLLNQSIKELNDKISILNKEILSMEAIFAARAEASYENSYINPFFMALGSTSIADALTSVEYFSTTRENDSKTISTLKNKKFVLNDSLSKLSKNQEDLSKTQSDFVKQKEDLVAQQNQLNSALSAYNSQKQQTENKKSNDQQEKSRIEQQLQAMREYANTSGNYRGNGGYNWYYSQLDPSWRNNRVGNSYYTIGEVGCLLTDIAMMATLYGNRVTPAQVAADPNNFAPYSAWLKIGGMYGLRLQSTFYDYSRLDREISNGRPIIVHMYRWNGEEHWVVVVAKSGNDYILNDPAQGGGVSYNRYYSSWTLDEMRLYAP